MICCVFHGYYCKFLYSSAKCEFVFLKRGCIHWCVAYDDKYIQKNVLHKRRNISLALGNFNIYTVISFVFSSCLKGMSPHQCFCGN